LPGTAQCFGEDAVELADVPERERAQKRPERRRRRHALSEHVPGATGAQHVAVVDAVRAERHRRNQRHDLHAGVGCPRTVPEAHRLVNKRRDPQALGKRRAQHAPGVRDGALVVEGDLHAVQSDRPVIVHHEGDLLSPGRDCPHSRNLPAQEVILHSPPDGTPATQRWIEAKSTFALLDTPVSSAPNDLAICTA
jgi:hypothetical protein